MQAYCDFYKVQVSDADLLTMSRALIADPATQGIQLVARDGLGTAVGFTTVFWTWQTVVGGRCAVLNDLFVDPSQRGNGLARRLISEVEVLARDHGARLVWWQTEKTNTTAQKAYDRYGAERDDNYYDYSLTL